MKSLTPFLALVALTAGLLLGCGEKPARLSEADSKAFASAPAAAKAAWEKALAAGNQGDFGAAIATLRALPKEGLAPEHIEAIQNALRTFNVKLAELAAKGDAAAKKALDDLKDLTSRPGR